MRNFAETKIKGILGCALLLASINGCTVVHVREEGGAVRTERHAGFLQVTFAATSTALADVWSLGYHASPFGVALGFSSLRIASMPPDCRLLLWVQANAPATVPVSAQAAAHSCVVQLNKKGNQE